MYPWSQSNRLRDNLIDKIAQTDRSKLMNTERMTTLWYTNYISSIKFVQKESHFIDAMHNTTKGRSHNMLMMLIEQTRKVI